MITTSGREVWPERGSPSLYDIGYGLSRMPRFAGQSETLYTVLQHTYVVAELVEPENRAYALLHDAGEAVRGDIPTSWKTDGDRRIENSLMRRIYREAGLLVPTKEIKREIKRADRQALMAEAHVIGVWEPEDRWPEQDIDAKAMSLTRMMVNNESDPMTADQHGKLFEVAVTLALESCERLRA